MFREASSMLAGVIASAVADSNHFTFQTCENAKSDEDVERPNCHAPLVPSSLGFHQADLSSVHHDRLFLQL